MEKIKSIFAKPALLVVLSVLFAACLISVVIIGLKNSRSGSNAPQVTAVVESAGGNEYIELVNSVYDAAHDQFLCGKAAGITAVRPDGTAAWTRKGATRFAVSGETVYILDGVQGEPEKDGVYALNAETGETERFVFAVSGLSTPDCGISVSPDGSVIVVSMKSKQRIILIGADGTLLGELPYELPVVIPFQGAFYAFDDYGAEEYDVWSAQGELLGEYDLPYTAGSYITDICISPDGQAIYLLSTDGVVYVLSGPSAEVKMVARGKGSDGYKSLSISPDGERLLLTRYDDQGFSVSVCTVQSGEREVYALEVDSKSNEDTIAMRAWELADGSIAAPGDWGIWPVVEKQAGAFGALGSLITLSVLLGLLALVSAVFVTGRPSVLGAIFASIALIAGGGGLVSLGLFDGSVGMVGGLPMGETLLNLLPLLAALAVCVLIWIKWVQAGRKRDSG